jgi:hypothetical protein
MVVTHLFQDKNRDQGTLVMFLFNRIKSARDWRCGYSGSELRILRHPPGFKAQALLPAAGVGFVSDAGRTVTLSPY